MNKNKEKLELYINQQRAMENKRIVFHKEVKITFEGKAILINEDKKETDNNYKIELTNNYILNRSGNYKILYTDSNNNLHVVYFSIRKKVPIFVFILLFLPIFLFNFLCNNNFINNLFEKKISISILDDEEQTEITPIYNFNMKLYNDKKESNSKTISLIETISEKEIFRKDKIAPGAKGNFTIAIDTYNSTQNIEYEIKIKDKTKKPHNLYFKSKDQTEYGSLEELAKKELKGILSSNSQKNFTIYWEWKYEISDEDNKFDVEDSIQIAKYEFEIMAVGREI